MLNHLFNPSLPPNAAGISYTIPTVQLPSGEWVMDSRTIAKRLEQLYPEPPLNIALDPYLAEIEDLADRTAQIVSPDFIPKIAKRVLGERSLGYWHRTREEWFMGQKLDKVAAEKGGPQVYREAAPLVARVTELLERNRAGPYFQGRIISYTDFIWASFLHFFEKLGGDSLEVLIGPNKESHLALLEACRPWLARYDH